ncbi:hypothetical protein GYMLUDRAFT_258722 [Collybiopsis luxurians FD-317 M1]|nr:hypothetical protein GYMLUDRAFT_258722 [Collybiopsis luxurians FD-317 M1]
MNIVNLPSASSLAFPSPPPNSGSGLFLHLEDGEMSPPLTPIDDDSDDDDGLGAGLGARACSFGEDEPMLKMEMLLEGPTQEQHEKDVEDVLDSVEKLLQLNLSSGDGDDDRWNMGGSRHKRGSSGGGHGPQQQGRESERAGHCRYGAESTSGGGWRLRWRGSGKGEKGRVPNGTGTGREAFQGTKVFPPSVRGGRVSTTASVMVMMMTMRISTSIWGVHAPRTHDTQKSFGPDFDQYFASSRRRGVRGKNGREWG